MPDVRGLPRFRARECELLEGMSCSHSRPFQISHVADERPAALSATSGTWRVGTKHKARVIGHSPMDGVIMLSFEKRVLEQRFMQVSEIKVGEVMKVRFSPYALLRALRLTIFVFSRERSADSPTRQSSSTSPAASTVLSGLCTMRTSS